MTRNPRHETGPDQPEALPQRFPVDVQFDRRAAEPVDDVYGGRVLAYAWANPDYRYEDVRKVLQAVGFTFEREHEGRMADYQPGTPDTVRLQAAAARNRVPLMLIAEASDSGNIPASRYAAVVRNLCHPVGVANIDSYNHDTAYDHMPAVVVGGQNLLRLIRHVAGRAAKKDVEISKRYDLATTYVSGALLGLLGNYSTEGDSANYYVDDEITLAARHMLGFRDWARGLSRRDKAHVNDVADDLRLVLTSGLQRMGISHRNILPTADRMQQARRRLGAAAIQVAGQGPEA